MYQYSHLLDVVLETKLINSKNTNDTLLSYKPHDVLHTPKTNEGPKPMHQQGKTNEGQMVIFSHPSADEGIKAKFFNISTHEGWEDAQQHASTPQMTHQPNEDQF